MNNEKPKTALAQLMDSVPRINQGKIEETKKDDENLFDSATGVENTTTDLGFMVMQYLDPNDCRPWAYADRPEEEMGNIDELAESIKLHGQQEPILVRQAVNSSGDYDYEIIFGNRRWRACLQADVKLIAIVKPLSNQQAALYQKEENENRKDLSDLSRAKSYKTQLDAGIFNSEKELSDILGISKQNLNDIMAYTRLPAELIDVLPHLNTISRKTVVKMSVLSKEKKKLKCMVTLAAQIDAKKITASNIEKYINKAMEIRYPKAHKEPENIFEVNDADNRLMFTIKQSASGDTTIKIHRRLKPTFELKNLRDDIYQYLVSGAR